MTILTFTSPIHHTTLSRLSYYIPAVSVSRVLAMIRASHDHLVPILTNTSSLFTPQTSQSRIGTRGRFLLHVLYQYVRRHYYIVGYYYQSLRCLRLTCRPRRSYSLQWPDLHTTKSRHIDPCPCHTTTKPYGSTITLSDIIKTSITITTVSSVKGYRRAEPKTALGPNYAIHKYVFRLPSSMSSSRWYKGLNCRIQSSKLPIMTCLLLRVYCLQKHFYHLDTDCVMSRQKSSLK
jgi:hypothetical protein